jgi:NAD+ synthase (glutamine-hydrolysing)
VLAVEALGKENVIGVLLPSEYSTSHSITDAKASAENLGIQHYTIPIKETFTSALKALSPVFEGKEPNVAEENIQSRIRGMILMGIANKIGAALLNTTNKSELSVGYGTLYGDTNGAVGALGDIYKIDVWEMSRWINRNKEIIPQNSIIKPPSAELRPDQKDTDSLPDYDILDKVLFLHLEQRLNRDELIAQGFESAVVDKILRLVKINEWKRHQAAPPLRMSNSALGIERIMPIS